MAITHLGADGYLKIERETVYGTAAVSSMTDLPCADGSTATGFIANIERPLSYNSRLKIQPSLGRKSAMMEISTELYPTLMGSIFRFFLGTSANSGSGAISHVYTMPSSGLNHGSSFTAQFAVGSDLADQITGNVINELSIEADSENNAKLMLKTIAQSYTRGVTRSSSISIPAAIPFNFSHCDLFITPAGGSEIQQPANNLSLVMNNNYSADRFKAGVSSNTISAPIFAGIPTVMFKCNIDAEKRFMNWANDDHKLFSIRLVFTSSEIASGSTPYSLQIILPGCQIKPETTLSTKMENIDVDLEFDCGFGGDTEDSEGVMAEITIVDAVASYAA